MTGEIVPVERRLVIAKRNSTISPKERAQLLRDLDAKIGPYIEETFNRAASGYLEWDDARWGVLMDFIEGPLADRILWGPCRSCGHAPKKHRGTNGPVDCECGCTTFAPSTDVEQRKKIFPIFEGFSKLKALGETDNDLVKALTFSMVSTYDTASKRMLAYLGVRHLEREPGDDDDEENGPELSALPAGS